MTHKYLFSGHVQGVGFRQTTVALAQDLPIGGTVRNLSDGRVELTVEGRGGDIQRLLERLGEHFGAMIREIIQVPGELAISEHFGEGIRVIS